MKITTVCFYCRYHDTDPILEINFKDGMIYYVCRECKQENQLKLVEVSKPLPKIKRM